MSLNTFPNGAIFEGDVTIEIGRDTNEYGYGDLYINRNLVIRGTDISINSTTASFILKGGASISKNLNVYGDLNVLTGTTRLTNTQIDTSVASFTCTGGNGISFIVGSDVILNSTGGSVQLVSGKSSSTAINLSSTNTLGGINIASGSNGRINLVSGSDGVVSTSNSGNTLITSNNALLDLVCNTQVNNQNLSISLLGNTNSKLVIDSAGNGNNALLLNTSNINGSIVISNNNGLGNGSTSILTGSAGFNLNTNTGGNIILNSQSGSINLTSNSGNSNQSINLSILGNTDSSILLNSSGTNSAIKLTSTNTSGNIFIAQTTNSTGKVDIFTGSGGFIVNTANTGRFDLSANGSVSLLTNNTNADNQNMNLSVLGNTASKIDLLSQGTGLDAIRIETTQNTGGILITASGALNLSSNNTVNIATAVPGTPVNIGSTNSVTTINGDFFVKGTTTHINSIALTVDDNITLLNNAPSGSSDAGLAIKRFQPANNTGSGDVVLDIPEESGGVSNGSNSTSTVHLSPGSSSVDNFYNNYWIRITSGTGALQVRKIKSYNGSTKVATIYITGENNNVTPIEGLNFSVILDTTSQYNLYNCQYVMTIWDETANEFAFICSSTNPTDKVSINHYTNLHVKQLISDSIITTTLNGLTADTFILVTLDNTVNIPQQIMLPNNYGVYTLMIEPLTSSVSCNAVFTISRVNDVSLAGMSNRIANSKGTHNEQLKVAWNANILPTLFFNPLPIGLSGSTVFKIKIIA
jgi:hypothetical protein